MVAMAFFNLQNNRDTIGEVREMGALSYPPAGVPAAVTECAVDGVAQAYAGMGAAAGVVHAKLRGFDRSGVFRHHVHRLCSLATCGARPQILHITQELTGREGNVDVETPSMTETLFQRLAGGVGISAVRGSCLIDAVADWSRFAKKHRNFWPHDALHRC